MAKPTILIVEDDGILAIHLEDLLTRQGYKVLKPVATGEKSIQEVTKQKPDLVIMDIELAGDMNGITAAEQIFAETDTPVVFLTGFSQDSLLQQAKIATPYGYLVKPVPDRELAATIEMALYKHKIDQQVKRSEAKYRALIEQASDGIFLSDKDGNYTEVNNAGCEMLGYSRDEILKMNLREIIAPENLAENPVRIKEMREGASLRTERVFVRKDGSRFPVEISGRMLENGVLQGIVRDITERKKIEKALQDSQWRSESIIEGTNAGTWEWNVQTGETEFNEVWAQIIGYSLNELEPISIKTWEMLTHPDDLNSSDKILEQHFAGELPYYDCECRMKHKDGHWVWVHDRGRVITYTDDGKPFMMFGTHTDITKRKLAEQALSNPKIEARLFFTR